MPMLRHLAKNSCPLRSIVDRGPGFFSITYLRRCIGDRKAILERIKLNGVVLFQDLLLVRAKAHTIDKRTTATAIVKDVEVAAMRKDRCVFARDADVIEHNGARTFVAPQTNLPPCVEWNLLGQAHRTVLGDQECCGLAIADNCGYLGWEIVPIVCCAAPDPADGQENQDAAGKQESAYQQHLSET